MDRTEKPTRYLDNDQRVAVQTLVSGGVETDGRMFVFGNYLDEVLVMHDGAGDLYYAHDHLSSPVALLDDAGAVLERYERACPEHSRGNAYGSVQILTSAFYPLASSQYGNPYTFTGRELDTMDNNTLHLMYYRARTYDPETGRFMQRDPLGVNPAGGKENPFKIQKQYADGANLQEYVKSNPITNRDPMGLEAIPKKKDDKACCKTETTYTASAPSLIWGWKKPTTKTYTSCTQVTIDSKGASPGHACKCHFKRQGNVKVYAAHSGECCWCDVYVYRYQGGFLGDPGLAHAGLNIICDQGRDSWLADVWPESQEGLYPLWPHYVPVQIRSPADDSADGGRGIPVGRISCDAADSWKSVLSSYSWLYQFPFSDCRDFVEHVGINMLKTCP
ncbi:MAG TPA: RHS repeat-associated core domain-containing protein [Anaerohalosphaeraceae bacterium]|nr:RHS repeat-associated core domain-containing protein [Anaerohalosphaeraceae bacterium]